MIIIFNFIFSLSTILSAPIPQTFNPYLPNRPNQHFIFGNPNPYQNVRAQNNHQRQNPYNFQNSNPVSSFANIDQQMMQFDFGAPTGGDKQKSTNIVPNIVFDTYVSPLEDEKAKNSGGNNKNNSYRNKNHHDTYKNTEESFNTVDNVLNSLLIPGNNPEFELDYRTVKPTVESLELQKLQNQVEDLNANYKTMDTKITEILKLFDENLSSGFLKEFEKLQQLYNNMEEKVKSEVEMIKSNIDFMSDTLNNNSEMQNIFNQQISQQMEKLEADVVELRNDIPKEEKGLEELEKVQENLRNFAFHLNQGMKPWIQGTGKGADFVDSTEMSPTEDASTTETQFLTELSDEDLTTDEIEQTTDFNFKFELPSKDFMENYGHYDFSY